MPGDEGAIPDPDGSCMSPARALRTAFPIVALVAFLALSPAASAGSKLRLSYRGGVLAGTLASPPSAGYRLVLNGRVVKRVHGRKFKFRLRTKAGSNLVIA